MKGLKIFRAISFLGIAVVAFIYAQHIHDESYGDCVYIESYGGDAYTGIQNAAADTGSNVYHGNRMIRFGFEGSFLIVGFAFFVAGVSNLWSLKDCKTIAKTKDLLIDKEIEENTIIDKIPHKNQV